jgi:hypothetical protein
MTGMNKYPCIVAISIKHENDAHRETSVVQRLNSAMPKRPPAASAPVWGAFLCVNSQATIYNTTI